MMGRSMISRVVSAFPVLTVLVSSIGDSPLTVIDSLTAPTSNWMSILRSPPSVRIRFGRTGFLEAG